MLGPNEVAAIEACQSLERIRPYNIQCNGNSALALRMYIWNAHLAGRFYGLIQLVEVGIRNACAYSLRNYLNINWFRDVSFVEVDPEITGKYKAARKELIADGKALTEGNFVAHYTLGYWTRLFAIEYEASLWAPILSNAFTPAAPTDRATVEAELLLFKNFRNRVAHGEPLWDRGERVEFERILRISSWIDESLESLVAEYVGIEVALRSRPGPGDNRFDAPAPWPATEFWSQSDSVEF